MFLTVTTSVKWHGQSCTYHSSGAASPPHCSITAQDECTQSGRKIINNSQGSLHPGRSRCKLTPRWRIKKETKVLRYLFVCYLSDAAGKELPKGEQLNVKCSFSFRLFCAVCTPRSCPPNTPLPRPPWGRTSRNLHQIRRCHIKNCVTEKAVMAGKDVAAVWVFLLGSVRAPLSFGVVRHQRELHSGPTCGSGIWSWWLCDSLGWGIAVSAEEVTASWSVTILRQAYVCRSCLGTAQRSPSHFALINNGSSLFPFSPKAQDGKTYCSTEKWPAMPWD